MSLSLSLAATNNQRLESIDLCILRSIFLVQALGLLLLFTDLFLHATEGMLFIVSHPTRPRTSLVWRFANARQLRLDVAQTFLDNLLDFIEHLPEKCSGQNGAADYAKAISDTNVVRPH